MMRGLIPVGLAGALLVGCGHGGVAENGELSRAKNDIGQTFGEAYAAVQSGAKATAQAGEYVFDKTREGATRVYHAARGGAKEAGGAVSDAYLSAKVKHKISSDEALRDDRIDVNTDAGVVTLKGSVGSEAEASRAVEDAIQTRGVYAVNSMLEWPASAAQRAPSSGSM